MAARVHIGTSGWHYGHWRGAFYPERMPSARFLSFYAERFRSAEINNSFYRLPSKETLHSWRSVVGPGFVFAFKASRYLTHMKKLRDPMEPLYRVYDAAETLEENLGPILFQLPPRWRFDADRLERFLELISDAHRHVFEFRDVSWFDERAYDLLRKHGAAFCIYELAGLRSPMEITADFAYVRLHGPGDKYSGRYDRQSLEDWAGTLSAWRSDVGDVYCFFDNDDRGYAAANARELQEMV